MKFLMAFFMIVNTSLALSHDIIDTARAQGKFTTLLKALEVTKLDQALATGHFTVMAPTDDAFAKLPDGVLDSLIQNPEALKGILLFHVGKGNEALKSIQAKGGLKTLSGKFLTTKTILNAGLNATDIHTNNGIIHVLDNVLIPSDATPQNEVQTVSKVDVKRYLGRWYEIARFEQSFQKGCGNVTADYSLRANGKVNVLNTCVFENGTVKTAKAIASVVDKKTNSKLKVSFVPFLNRFGFFAGDYWIIGLGDNYEYAVVGSPDRQYLWFLSRTPSISNEKLNELKQIAESQGFDLSKLMMTPDWK
jgi:apolipoprotein D and lipocalin family protein